MSSELADLFCETLDQFSALRCFDSNRVARICYLGSILRKPVLPSLSLRFADYLMHTFITQFMSGPSLGPLADRFTSNLIDRLEGEDISGEWKEYPNLYTFVRDHMLHASGAGLQLHQKEKGIPKQERYGLLINAVSRYKWVSWPPLFSSSCAYYRNNIGHLLSSLSVLQSR